MTFEAFKNQYGLKLNSAQCEAAQAVEGPVLLLAVPGSGNDTALDSVDNTEIMNGRTQGEETCEGKRIQIGDITTVFNLNIRHRTVFAGKRNPGGDENDLDRVTAAGNGMAVEVEYCVLGDSDVFGQGEIFGQADIATGGQNVGSICGHGAGDCAHQQYQGEE